MKNKHAILGILSLIFMYTDTFAQSHQIIDLATKGDADAQLILGYMYLGGNEEIPKDSQKAKYWINKSAQQGDIDAQAVLGTIYYNEENYSAAIPLLHTACNHGNTLACSISNKIDKGAKPDNIK